MELVLRNKDQEISGNNKYSGVSTFGDNVVVVNTVSQLEAAVAAQTAGQTIVIVAGDYTLTKSLEILLAASGGGLKAYGCVNIIGAASADEAILIDPAVATATFEYTLEGINSIKGGANKIGLHVLDTATNKKVNVYLKQTSLNDNGTGKALTVVNSDGSNAIRIYADGPAEIDSIAFTPKDNSDRLVISGYDINENIVIAAVDCTATFAFRQCKLPHEGVTGGHANNVCSAVGCWTEETEYVTVDADAYDFPGALNPVFSVTPTIEAALNGDIVTIGNDAKTGYNKLTGHTKIDNRPTGGTIDDYALQVRSESAKTTGTHWGLDGETHLKATGGASLRSVQGVAVVDAGYTATAATIIGAYGQARVDGDMAGASFLAGLYGLIENSTALTASHVAALWLDTHQANAITGSYQLMYMTENGAEPLDQVMYMRTPGAKALMELDTCSTFVSAGSETAGDAKKIKITIDGVAYYINAYPGA